MTRNRQQILDIINNSTDHLTAEDIYRMTLGSENRMSMATIYNNLHALYGDGMIRRISLDGQPERYDKIKRHDHLICTKCGRIKDLYLKDIIGDIESESGMDVDSYDLRVYYVCGDCRRKLK